MDKVRSEKEKMLSGEDYRAMDAELVKERKKAIDLFQKYNKSSAGELKLRREILKDLIPQQGKDLFIEPPFYCDYGYNIRTGNNVFFNFNCVILDVMPVHIGDHVLFGPAVQVYTALHPMDWRERSGPTQSAKPVSIGSHVWIGGGAIICPGVSIGERSVIGAGSVVTRDIPAGVFAAGNPCRVVKKIEEKE